MSNFADAFKGKKYIFFKAGSKILLTKKFYILVKGRAIVRYLFLNGNVIPNENIIYENEILGNFLNFLHEKHLTINGLEIEVEFFEDSVLEEFIIDFENVESNDFIKYSLSYLIKSNLMNIFYHFYDKERYFLMILKIYANGSDRFEKKMLKCENINVSKSQFYLILNSLKSKKFIEEGENDYILNYKLIDEYLTQYEIE